MNRSLALAAAALAVACSRPTPPPSSAPDAAPPPEVAAPAAADAGPGAAPAAPALDGGAPSDAGAVGDAGAPADGGAPAAGAPPARPAAPAPLPVTGALARVGALEVPVAREAVTTVDPGSAFELALAVRLADGRLSLRDEADAMVASTATTELSEGATRYRLVPDEPLRPGSRYALHLDGAVTREPHGDDGAAYAPAVYQLKTSGERPAAPARKKRTRR